MEKYRAYDAQAQAAIARQRQRNVQIDWDAGIVTITPDDETCPYCGGINTHDHCPNCGAPKRRG